MFGNQLQYADRQWLERIRLGISLRLWGIGLGVPVIATAIIAAIVKLPIGILVVFALVAGVVDLWASFAITMREPMTSLHEDKITWRKTIRFCAAVTLLGIFMARIGRFVGIPSSLQVAGVTAPLFGLVVTFGELLYLSRFATRIPDPELARSTKIVMWSFTVSCVFFISAGFCEVSLVAPMGGKPVGAAGPGMAGSAPFSSIAPAIMSLAGLALVVFWIWKIVLLVRYRRAFTAAVDKGLALGTAADTPVPPQGVL